MVSIIGNPGTFESLQRNLQSTGLKLLEDKLAAKRAESQKMADLERALQIQKLKGQQSSAKDLEQAKANFKLGQKLGVFDPNINSDELFDEVGSVSPQAVSQAANIHEKRREEEDKEAKEKVERELIAKKRRGETLTPEEEATLSSTTQRAFLQAEKPVFETEADKLEAKRVSDFRTELTNKYTAAQDENLRISRQEKLIENGKLSAPATFKLFEKVGIPIGILGNPDNEEYDKEVAKNVTNINNVFRGQIRVAELEAYMKTFATALNSPQGKLAIIHNKKIENEMTKARYEAMNSIIQENNGRTPANLDYLVGERTKEQTRVLSERYRQGISKALEKYAPTVPMYDADGKRYDIPVDKISQAQKKNLEFR